MNTSSVRFGRTSAQLKLLPVLGPDSGITQDMRLNFRMLGILEKGGKITIVFPPDDWQMSGSAPNIEVLEPSGLGATGVWSLDTAGKVGTLVMTTSGAALGAGVVAKFLIKDVSMPPSSRPATTSEMTVRSTAGSIIGGPAAVAMPAVAKGKISGVLATVQEVQTAVCTGTGGTFTLSYSGQTTVAIAFDATAAVVATAFSALSSVTSGTVAFST